MRGVLIVLFISASLSTLGQAALESDSISKKLEEILVFPNPTSEILFVRGGEHITSYQLVSMQGKICQEGKGKTQIISLVDDPIGDYFLFIEIQGQIKRFRVRKY